MKHRIVATICVFVGFLAAMVDLNRVAGFETRCFLIFASLGMILVALAALWWDLIAKRTWE